LEEVHLISTAAEVTRLKLLGSSLISLADKWIQTGKSISKIGPLFRVRDRRVGRKPIFPHRKQKPTNQAKPYCVGPAKRRG
jgi:hypothetical protein